MSWSNELYNIYEFNSGRKFSDGEPIMLPVSHSTANAQIELTIDEDGNFMGAAAVDKSDAVTVIPVTEDSGVRTSGIFPMPLADKLLYIAGDYEKYISGKKADNSAYFEAYMKQLSQWKNSEFSHKAVKAIYAYLAERTLMNDLIECGVLKIDAESGKLAEKAKIAGIAQADSFVRFIVYYRDKKLESRTWKDKSLHESFMNFNSSMMGNVQLCYASGAMEAVTYKHPSKIRHSGDKAKLISSNDESGFSYRGRFKNKEEAFAVSYNFSQKMHNALKWLIQKQGIRFDSMTLIVWASALQEIPPIDKSLAEYHDPIDNEEEETEKPVPDTLPKYSELIKKMMFGYKSSLSVNTKIMIMGLDAATTGRLSISIYSELENSQFLENLEKWHSETVWRRWDGKNSKNYFNSFSVRDIINCAYGREQDKFLKCDEKLLKTAVLRLLPCITEGVRIPRDIVRNLYQRASNPMAYENNYNHRLVLETACAMIRKEYLDYQKGELTMAYDPDEKDRSYRFGCLLAIADKAEKDTYSDSDRKDRITNARRYWNAFSLHPSQTWKIIEERLNPYLNKLGGGLRDHYEKRIEEIMSGMSASDFDDNSSLSPLYLLGYHHYTAKLYSGKTEE